MKTNFAELDFTHTIVHSDIDKELELYVLVKFNFDEEGDLEYGFTIHKDVGREDITDIIQFLDESEYNDINDESLWRCQKYIEEYEEEHRI